MQVSLEFCSSAFGAGFTIDALFGECKHAQKDRAQEQQPHEVDDIMTKRKCKPFALENVDGDQTDYRQHAHVRLDKWWNWHVDIHITGDLDKQAKDES